MSEVPVTAAEPVLRAPFEGSSVGYEVHVESTVVTLRDGATLATDIHRPALGGAPVEGRFPTVLERTPYDRTRRDLLLTARFFASRGYIVVLQDVRGRYGSDGEFHFLLHTQEELDGYDTVEWIATQPWSEGRVGTTGLSYTGINQQALAVGRPPHLTTQVILDGGYNYWRQCIRHNGALGLGVALPYVLYMASTGKEAQADPAVRDHLLRALQDLDKWLGRVPLRRGASPLALAPSYEDWYLELQARANYDEAWQNPLASLESRIGDYPDIPLCLVTSWYGHHAAGTVEKFNALRAQRGPDGAPIHMVSGIWLHAWEYTSSTHAGDVDFGRSAAFVLDDFRLRWFDEHLKGLHTGLRDEDPVRIFVMGGGSGEREVSGRLAHGGRWVSGGSWPLEDVEQVPYHLGAIGTLGEDPPPEPAGVSFTFDPRAPVPTVGGHVQNPTSGVTGVIHGGAFDQRGRADLALSHDLLPLATRPDVLVFATEPLAEAVEIADHVRVRLWVSSSAPDTDITAKLVDHHPATRDFPDGFAMNLTDGIQRLRYRRGRTTPELLTPGEVYEIEISLPPTANRFGRGHRIRLDISSSSFPQFDVNRNTGGPLDGPDAWRLAENTIHVGGATPSAVLLPMRRAPASP